MLDSYLTSEGFIQSESDSCVYVKTAKSTITILISWVDDILVASNSTDSLTEVKGNLGDRFQMKDLGVLSWFLGKEFICKENTIKMRQTKYKHKILSRFKMQNCK